MRFEWDNNKAIKNLRKHGISFEEVVEVFNDPNAADEIDEAHSENEVRFNIIGLCARGLVFVVFNELENNCIRLISARRATKFEEEIYVKG